MAVDEAGREDGAAQVVLGAVAEAGGQLGVGADPAQGVAVDQQRAVVDPAPGAVGGHRGQARVAPEGECHVLIPEGECRASAAPRCNRGFRLIGRPSALIGCCALRAPG